MSAYALPGSLFPPIGPASHEASSSCSSGTTASISVGPLHRTTPRDGRIASIPPLLQPGSDSSLSPVAVAALAHEKEDSPRTSRCSELGIAVKAARIDPVRLVQSVTGRSNSTSKRQRGRNVDTPNDRRPPSSQVVDCGLAEESVLPPAPPLSVVETKIEDKPLKEDRAASSHTGSREAPHEDAIQFELSISFNGRTYTATRTLPRIIELRNELISELNIRRRQLQPRRMRWRRPPGGKTMDRPLEDDDTVATVDEDCCDLDEGLDVIIPELPDCIADNTETGAIHSGGFGSRGFTMLQALLRSYCPAMERWLRNVADIVPPNSSPSLTNFLWEPLSQIGGTQDRGATDGSTISSSPRASLGKPRGSFSTLDSIDEADDGCVEEDGTTTERDVPEGATPVM